MQLSNLISFVAQLGSLSHTKSQEQSAKSFEGAGDLSSLHNFFYFLHALLVLLNPLEGVSFSYYQASHSSHLLRCKGYPTKMTQKRETTCNMPWFGGVLKIPPMLAVR